MNNLNGAYLLLAFLGGAVVGAAAAFLTTPFSGTELRDQVLKTMREKQSEMQRIPPALRDAYTSAAEAARVAFTATYNEQTDIAPKA